jgi:hypothetical protein
MEIRLFILPAVYRHIVNNEPLSLATARPRSRNRPWQYTNERFDPLVAWRFYEALAEREEKKRVNSV